MKQPTLFVKKAATAFGTVCQLPNTGNVIADIAAALAVACNAKDFDENKVSVIRQQDRETAGLREEAGYGGHPDVSVFHTHTERLATGQRLGAWLTLSNTSVGDAVYWNISIIDDDRLAVCSATRAGADAIMAMLRKVAGGPSTEIKEN